MIIVFSFFLGTNIKLTAITRSIFNNSPHQLNVTKAASRRNGYRALAEACPPAEAFYLLVFLEELDTRLLLIPSCHIYPAVPSLALCLGVVVLKYKIMSML